MKRMFSIARRYAALIALGTVAAVGLVAASVVPASAHGVVTSGDIKNQTIRSWDISRGGVASSEIRNQSIKSVDISAGGVGTSEVRNQSLRSWDISAEGVGTSEIRNGTIRNEDLSDEVQTGQGPKGDKGDPGQDGQDGVSGLAIPTENFDSLPTDERDTFGVYCPDGTNAIGGGYAASGGAVVTADKPWWGTAGTPQESSDPDRAIGWNVSATLNDGTVTVWAICAAVN